MIHVKTFRSVTRLKTNQLSSSIQTATVTLKAVPSKGKQEQTALHSLIKKRSNEVEGEVAAYAMLQAANLRSSVDLQNLIEVPQQKAMEIMDAQENVVLTLMPIIEAHIKSFPSSTQISIVSALAQLQHYSEVIFDSVAETCISLNDATGGIIDALAAASSSSAVSAEVKQPPPHGDPTPSPSSSSPSSTSQGIQDEHGVIGLQLLMISSAFALAGHYNEILMDLIADQTIQYLENIESLPVLINILGSFMDLQHDHRDLLLSLGDKLDEQMSNLEPEGAAMLILLFSFFRVENETFYADLLRVASRFNPKDIDPKSMSMLYRGLKLLPEPKPSIPEEITALLQRALTEFGPFALSVTSPSSIPSLELLQEIERKAEQPETAQLIMENRMFEIMVRSDVYSGLTLLLGLNCDRNITITTDGWLLGHICSEADGYKLVYQVLSPDRACQNIPTRLRGQILSEILCMQLAGWVVIPVLMTEFLSVMSPEGPESGQNDSKMQAMLVKHLENLTSDAVGEFETLRNPEPA
ncbi:hypothetical protein CEUSTIGMA_g661.t1 [Chlamydomonas eustigma]|uniref:Uncharacterized protein n=1 Tax=Chlamydomonas eustigma TaxID=1157962 RepID=A0A250WQW0_9CHLO|nr:hypothetical protein CEUSTIGMA_g661.t1 [Chlamydomonas eustigma]|eukprot:GAX73208.1 hypothetical protein CEUSTIGMA_g661.t1 [Chlamydomonas eustigma]